MVRWTDWCGRGERLPWERACLAPCPVACSTVMAIIADGTAARSASTAYVSTLPVAEARTNLSRLIDDATTTHERFQITRNGRRAAVLLSADDYDTMQDTIAVLSDPELLIAHARGRAAVDAGDHLDAEELIAAMRAAGRLPGLARPSRGGQASRFSVVSGMDGPPRLLPHPVPDRIDVLGGSSARQRGAAVECVGTQPILAGGVEKLDHAGDGAAGAAHDAECFVSCARLRRRVGRQQHQRHRTSGVVGLALVEHRGLAE